MELTGAAPARREEAYADAALRERAARAVAAGIAFLERVQLPSGELRILLSRDDTPAPVPDACVFGTALVAAALTGVEGTGPIRARAADFLAAQMLPGGVWRHWTRGSEHFRLGFPPDLDDTAMSSLCLADQGRTIPPHRPLFLANRDPRGLFYSWITPRRKWVPIAAFWRIALVQLTHPLSYHGFFTVTPSRRGDVDAVVNANVLAYLGRSADTEAVVPFLLKIMEEGREDSCDKWYDNPFAIWYFFSRALRGAGADAGGVVLARLRTRTAGDALEHALAACASLDWGVPPARDSIAAIMDAQLGSGAWPHVNVYHGDHWRWGAEALTTAYCLEALTRWAGLAGA